MFGSSASPFGGAARSQAAWVWQSADRVRAAWLGRPTLTQRVIAGIGAILVIGLLIIVGVLALVVGGVAVLLAGAAFGIGRIVRRVRGSRPARDERRNVRVIVRR